MPGRLGTPPPNPAASGSAGAVEAGPPPRLVDLAGDWLALIAALRSAGELPDAAKLRERAQALRNDLERGGRAAGFADADLEAATFSLTAFFDETVRRARGLARSEWIARPLQLEWFQTPRAGVEFYERLEALRKERGKRIESLEVAASCVALGFEGQLATDTAKRAALLEDLLGEIAAVRGTGEVVLAPHVTPRDRAFATVVPELPRWISAAAFVVIALILWLGVSQLSHLKAARAADVIHRPLSR